MESYAMPFSGKCLAASTSAPGKFSGVYFLYFLLVRKARGDCYTLTHPRILPGV